MIKPALVLTLLFLTLLFLTFSVFASDLPTFEQYPADEPFDGMLRKVDLQSHPDARMFRTRLRENEGGPPNFAGRYIVTLWGCGSGCQMIAIIDATNGKISFPLDEPASYGACYRKESRLLIINPLTQEDIDSHLPEWLETRYYEWDGSSLNLLADSRSAVEASCD